MIFSQQKSTHNRGGFRLFRRFGAVYSWTRAKDYFANGLAEAADVGAGIGVIGRTGTRIGAGAGVGAGIGAGAEASGALKILVTIFERGFGAGAGAGIGAGAGAGARASIGAGAGAGASTTGAGAGADSLNGGGVGASIGAGAGATGTGAGALYVGTVTAGVDISGVTGTVAAGGGVIPSGTELLFGASGNMLFKISCRGRGPDGGVNNVDTEPSVWTVRPPSGDLLFSVSFTRPFNSNCRLRLFVTVPSVVETWLLTMFRNWFATSELTPIVTLPLTPA